MARLALDLNRISDRAPAWRRRIGSYLRALHRELPIERTIATVAKSGEVYPLEQVVYVRERALRRTGRRLGRKCAQDPL
jgi:hypothetical protein